MKFKLIESLSLTNNQSYSLYKHEKFGAEIIHHKNHDNNLLFSYVFPSVPGSNKGVAHVLEHCILDKCDVYAKQNVFMELRKSSIANIMNATTYSDKTTYYAGSYNYKDLQNIFEVVTNIVFFPSLDEQTFVRECFNIAENGKVTGGIVYNEVKGYYSDSRIFLTKQAVQSSYSKTPFEYDAGGIPNELFNIKLDQIRNFHNTFYTAKNMKLYVYGNQSIEPYLKLLEKILPNVNRNVKELDFTKFKLSKPHLWQRSFSSNSGFKEAFIINWALPQIQNIDDFLFIKSFVKVVFAQDYFKILTRLKEELNADLLKTIPCVDFDLKYPILSLGFENQDFSQIEKIQNIITERIISTFSDKFNCAKIYSEYKNELFNLKAKSLKNTLMSMNRVFSAWIYGKDPQQLLREPKHFNSKKFEESIRNLINSKIDFSYPNSIVHVVPALENQNNITEKKENEMDFQSLLTPKKAVPQNTFPKLGREDVVFHDESYCFTNKKQSNFDLSYIIKKNDELASLNLFSPVILQSKDDISCLKLLSLLIQKHIEQAVSTKYSHNFSCRAEVYLNENKDCIAGLLFTLSCLQKDLVNLVDNIYSEIYNLEQFKINEIDQIITQEIAWLQGDLMFSGMRYAFRRSLANHSIIGCIDEYFSGLSYLAWLKKNSDHISSTIKTFTLLIKKLTSTPRLYIAVISDEYNIEMISKATQKYMKKDTETLNFYTNLKFQDFDIHLNEVNILPSQIGYSTLCLPGEEYGTKEFAALTVGAQALTSNVLWKKIRLEIGAYSASAIAMGREKAFAISSHMDPAPFNTLDTIEQVLTKTNQLFQNDLDLEQSIIRIANYEYVSRNNADLTHKKIHHMVMGINDTFYHNYRKELLNLEYKTIKLGLEKLANDLPNKSRTVICNVDQLKQQKLDLWTIKDWSKCFVGT